MERNINWTFLLLIISFIGRSLSAVSFAFEHQDPEKAYKESRSASVHRGLFLSYSSSKKTELCRDMFSEYANEKSLISDELRNEGQPHHALIVGKISQFVERYWLEGKVEDIFFQCSGKNLKPELSADIEYFVSSTFRNGFMYNGAHEYTSEGMIGVVVNGYIGMSPGHVSLGQTGLEKQYDESRRIIRDLREEAPLYVKMIEDRDPISALSIWQKFLLCSSIISSPTHASSRHKLSFNWINYTNNVKKGIHQYKRKPLTFIKNNKETIGWWANCLYCTLSTGAANTSGTVHPNVILTRAYNNKHSVYVLLEENGLIRLEEYVENIPISMNMHVPFTNDPEYVHESELK